jgi:hypothetical protein
MMLNLSMLRMYPNILKEYFSLVIYNTGILFFKYIFISFLNNMVCRD